MSKLQLHPSTIQQVQERADIVEIISAHLVLRRRGKDFVGLCPFHDDKSPSFSVSPTKQLYYCFGCGAGGNSIKFLMELQKLSFAEVVVELANRYQVPLVTLEPEQQQKLQRQLSLREQLYEILALAGRFYEHALHQNPQTLTYLQQERRLPLGVIQHFQLGYAPAGWETLFNYLVQQKHYPAALVEQAGLVTPRPTGDYYDRFRGRLMIPIHDLQGRVIGFGGRSFGDEQPKYLNSPETELFSKGKTLFALDKARVAISKQDRAILVEGYFDAIALHAAGITNVVASLGTALNQEQVKAILRYTESKTLILNFDSDTAGLKATSRALAEVASLAYQGEIQPHILTLPAGKDPDEYLSSHTAAQYQALLDQAPLWLDWQIHQILADKDLTQADQFHHSVQALIKLLGNLPNSPLRTHYLGYCAELLSRGESRRVQALETDLRAQLRRPGIGTARIRRPGVVTLRAAAEAKLLQIYLHCPDQRSEWRRHLASRLGPETGFSLPEHQFLWEQIQGIEQANPASLDLLTPLQDLVLTYPQEMETVSAILRLTEKTKIDISRPEEGIAVAVTSLERVECEQHCQQLLADWQQRTLQEIQGCMQALLEVPDEPGESLERLHAQLDQNIFDLQRELYKHKKRLEALDNQRCLQGRRP